jgi:hypothetical protein
VVFKQSELHCKFVLECAFCFFKARFLVPAPAAAFAAVAELGGAAVAFWRGALPRGDAGQPEVADPINISQHGEKRTVFEKRTGTA